MTGVGGPPRARASRVAAPWWRVPAETVVFASLALVTLAVLGLGLPTPPPPVQAVLLGVLAGVLGLPHGALDPLIARRAGLWRSPVGFAGFNAAYVLVVVGVVLLWLVVPVLSLVAFLLVSALHFGSDWNADRSLWLRWFAGFGLLSMPAWSHPDQVRAIYVVLAGDGGRLVADVQERLGPVALAGLVLAALLALRHRPHESVEIVLATVLGLAAEPLVFFLLYFCALHSVRHLKAGFREERGGGRLPAVMVAVYTVVPLVVAGAVLVALGPGGVPGDRVLQLVFIGLAGLTVPHMIVVGYENRLRRAAGAGRRVSSPG